MGNNQENVINKVLPGDSQIDLKIEEQKLASPKTEKTQAIKKNKTSSKDEEKRDRLESVLYHLLESIRVCAVFLEPFLPETSKELLRQLNTEDKSFGYGAVSVYQLNEPQVLFARIDKEKLSKDM